MNKHDAIIYRLNIARLENIRKSMLESTEADVIRAAAMPVIESELKELMRKLEVRV